jgi:hypothetical protein
MLDENPAPCPGSVMFVTSVRAWRSPCERYSVAVAVELELPLLELHPSDRL